MSSTSTISFLVGVAMFGLLLVMFIGGLVLMIRSRRGGPGYPSCGGCSYDLTGSIGEVSRCPECGVDVAVAGIVPPGGQRSTTRIAIGGLLVLISVSCLGIIFIPALLLPLGRTVAPVRTPPPQATEVADAPAAAQPE